MNNKLRPCDCIDEYRAVQLDHRGISTNGDGITVEFGKVKLVMGASTLMIPFHRFKQWATWFLQEQEIQ